jgi:hypothetical protein
MPEEILLVGFERERFHYLYITNLRIMECEDSYLETTINVWRVTRNVKQETLNLSIDERFKIIPELERKCKFQIKKEDVSSIDIVKRYAGLFSKSLVADILVKLKTGKEKKYFAPFYDAEVFVDSIMRFFPEAKITEIAKK